jgi:guanylate kinase
MCVIHVNRSFVQPPSLGELESRLNARGSETPESLTKRLASAQEAFDLAAVPGIYDLVLVNDDVDAAVSLFPLMVVRQV